MVRDYRPSTIRWVRVFDEHVWAIEVVWSDGDNDIVNLSPLLRKRTSLLRRFERSPDKFWDITIVDGGRALSWFNASVDISARVIADLVYEQRKKQDTATLYDNNLGLTPTNARVTDTFDARNVDVSLDFRVTDSA